MTVKTAMTSYFEWLIAETNRRHHGLPRTPLVEDAEPTLYVGEPDANEYIQWRPMEKTSVHDLGPLERRFGISFHSSIFEYFNSYWFLQLGGQLDRRSIELMPVVPGLELDQFTTVLQSLVDHYGPAWGWAPIGIEANTGFAVVTKTDSGAVALWNLERESAESIAPDLSALITALAR